MEREEKMTEVTEKVVLPKFNKEKYFKDGEIVYGKREEVEAAAAAAVGAAGVYVHSPDGREAVGNEKEQHRLQNSHQVVNEEVAAGEEGPLQGLGCHYNADKSSEGKDLRQQQEGAAAAALQLERNLNSAQTAPQRLLLPPLAKFTV